MVYLESYDRIIDGAVASYRSMPFETRELYKKYTLNFEVPPQTETPSNGFDALKREIASGSRLRFDLSNGKDGFLTKSEFINVIDNKPGQKAGHADALPEEKLGKYIIENSRSRIIVEIPDNREAKLNFMLLGDNASLPIEIIVNVGRGSKLGLFEWFASSSTSASVVAPFHVVNVSKDSEAEINLLHNENYNTDVGALNKATIEDNSSLRFNAIYNGGKVTRSTTFAEAAGKGSNLLVNEIVFGHAEQKFDVNAFLLNSNEFTKAVLKSGAVLRGKSFCILKGYAKVTKGTKGSYSNVEEKGLVMDPEARMQPLPDMSIDCKDVAFASHSAATSPVDRESMFYLMSRGIDENKAKRIFVASFLSKYLANIQNDIVKEIAISILLDKLDNDRHSQVPKISMQNLWIVPSEKVKK